MASLPDETGFDVIVSRLESVAAAQVARPSWYEQWKRLPANAAPDDVLAAFQAIRDSGGLPREAAFYLVAWQIDRMTDELADDALSDLADEIQQLAKQAAHVRGKFLTPDDEPDEVLSLRFQYEDAREELFAEMLSACGEAEMARLLRSDPLEFERMEEEGRLFFHGAYSSDIGPVPPWLQRLVDAVNAHTLCDGPPGSLGVLYREETGYWEVAVFPLPVEVMGGRDDGAVVTPGLSLDLLGLQEVFDELTDCGWATGGAAEFSGPHAWVEGLFEGQEVIVNILAEAPEAA